MVVRRLRSTLVALALLPAVGCLKVPSDLQDPGTRAAPSTAKEVLDRHIVALGGDEALRAITQRTVEARMMFHPEEGCEKGDETCLSEERTGTFVLRSTAKGQLYRRTVVGELVEERGFDKDTGWRLQNGVLLLEDAREAARSREDAALHWYFDLEQRGVEVVLQSPRNEDTDGETRTLDGLTWTVAHEGVPPKTLWFDRATGLLREEIVEEQAGDEALTQTIIYDDYKEIDGVLVPHTIRLVQALGAREQTVEFVTQRVDHGAIAARLFDMPELPKPEPKKDAKLQTLADARAAAQAEPKDASLAVAHARAAFSAARMGEAIEAANKTLKRDPKEPEALFILARAQLLRGETSAASKTLKRAGRAGIRKEAISVQQAWIHSRRGDYARVAKAMDAAGQPMIAGRYRAFAGKPLQVRGPGKSCVASLPLAIRVPLAAIEVRAGDEAFLAMIDTGATDVILADDLATRLGVVEQARTPVPGGGHIGHGQLEQLGFGDVAVTNIPVDLFPAQSITDMAGNTGSQVKAVLGSRLLQRFQTTLDVPAGVVELTTRSKACRSDLSRHRAGTAVPFLLHETHYMYVNAKLNEAEGLYLVNTGMRGAAVTGTQLAFAHAGVGTPPLRAGETPMVTVGSLALADTVRAEKIPAAFGVPEQTETSDGFRLDGMIGLDLLASYRWTIDFDEQRFYFAKSKPKPEPKPEAKPAAAGS